MSQVLMQWYAARRLDAEALISLSRRRQWYADDPAGEGDKPAGSEKPADPGSGDKPAGGEAEVPDFVKDPAKAYAEIQKLRNESAAERTKRTNAERTLSELQQAAKDAEKQKLVEGKDFQKLYEEAEREKQEALQRAATTALENLRLKVGTAAGLPADLIERLRGASEDELKADAEKLKAFVADPKKPRTTSDMPGGDPAGETYEQRKARIYGQRGANPFGRK